MKKSEILERAHALISQPGTHVTGGSYARDGNGKSVYGCDPGAVSWCAVGAVQHLVGSVDGDEHDATYLLHDAAKKVTDGYTSSAYTVNDHMPREVLDATFHTAIAMAREQEAAA